MIKSKEAKEYLFEDTTCNKEFREMADLIPIHDAVKAIELDESELYSEEECIEALKNVCHYSIEMIGGLYCSLLQNKLGDGYEFCQGTCEYGRSFISRLKSDKHNKK